MKNSPLFIVWVLSVRLTAQAYSLTECVDIALMNKETAKVAALDQRAAELNKKGSLSNILPEISFGSSWSKTNTPIGEIASSTYGSVFSSFGSSFSLSQTLYDGGLSLNQIRSANNSFQIVRQAARQQRIAVILNVHQAFYQLLKNQQLLAVERKNLDLARQQVELVELQFELGAVKKTDLLKAEVQLGRSKTNVLIQETNVRNAELELRNSMGLIGSATHFEVVDESSSLMPLPELDESIANIEEFNPSLLVSRAQIMEAQLNRKIIFGSRLPRLSTTMSYGTTADEFSTLSKMENWSTSISLSLSIPLFSGYNLSTQQQTAELALRKQHYVYLNKKNDLQVQLENLLNSLANFQELIPLNEQVLTLAEEDLKLVQQRYSLGSAIILEVLDAQVSVSQARSILVSTKYDARIQETQLQAVLGTLDQNYR